ncbi:MAG: carbon-nitrogen hydrolase [Pseudomonadota bacterium]
MTLSTLKTAVIQHAVFQPCSTNPPITPSIGWHEWNKAKTTSDLIEKIRQAAQQQAQLIVLTELHSAPYFCQSENTGYFELAEHLDNSPTLQALLHVAAETNVVLVGSIFEKRMAGVFHNTSVVIDGDKGLAGIYRKTHIPDDPGFYEKYYFVPGDYSADQAYRPVETRVGKLGVLICWDQWYPEAARLMALAGADVLIYPTAIGWDPQEKKDEQLRQQEAWLTVQRGHAVANHLPVVIANRVGFEQEPNSASSGIQFWGNSALIGPQGEFLARGAEDKEEILIYDLPLHRTESLRRLWPFLRDRRIDLYSGLLNRVR